MSLPASLTLKRPVCYPLIFAVSLTYSQTFALDAKLPEPTTKHLHSKSMLPQVPKIDTCDLHLTVKIHSNKALPADIVIIDIIPETVFRHRPVAVNMD